MYIRKSVKRNAAAQRAGHGHTAAQRTAARERAGDGVGRGGATLRTAAGARAGACPPAACARRHRRERAGSGSAAAGDGAAPLRGGGSRQPVRREQARQPAAQQALSLLFMKTKREDPENMAYLPNPGSATGYTDNSLHRLYDYINNLIVIDDFTVNGLHQHSSTPPPLYPQGWTSPRSLTDTSARRFIDDGDDRPVLYDCNGRDSDNGINRVINNDVVCVTN
uniref:Uncharacterized protein n=1 Tax=Leersia perrieri TaxID=77586 RepID=A0A0D9XSS5_9ORYZ